MKMKKGKNKYNYCLDIFQPLKRLKGLIFLYCSTL